MISLVVPGMVNSSYAHPASVWKSYLLLPDAVGPLLAVGWTLIHEMYFYIGFAFILAIGISLRRALIGWACVVVLIHEFFIQSLTPTISPVATVLFHPLTIEFIVGAMIGLAIKRDIKNWAFPSLTLGTIILVTAFVIFKDPQGLVYNVTTWYHLISLGLPFALIVYGCAAMENKNVLIPMRFCVRLGDASYLIYLGHVLIMSAIGRLFFAMPAHNKAIETAMVLACLTASNIVGLLSYRFIEKPMINFSRRVSVSGWLEA